MRDWQAFVRTRLDLAPLTLDRSERIVREVAAQLADVYRDARARGLTDADADAETVAQIPDWTRFAADIRRAVPHRHRPPVDRFCDRLDTWTRPSHTSGGSVISVLSQILRDARLGLRHLVRAPAFAAAAILTAALGIGATTAVFSVVNGVLLRPLPFGDADSIVHVYELVPEFGRFSVAPATFLDWQEQSRAFDGLIAYTGSTGTFTGDTGPERLEGAAVTPETFRVLGVRPELGAGFGADQDRAGAPPAIVISHGLWLRRFNGEPDVVGRAITVDGVATTIVAVMPAQFYFPTRAAEFWEPLTFDRASAPRGAHYLGVIGRLRSGVTLDEADLELKTISGRLASQYPQAADESAEVIRQLDHVVGPVRPVLLILFAAVGVIVLIACANVANLLLVRASARSREFAIRAALGAGRRRLVVQMLSESLLLAALAGCVGLVLAYGSVPVIHSLGHASIPRVADIMVDTRVLWFTIAASTLTGLVFGLAPTWHASRARPNGALQGTTRGSIGSGRQRLRSALVVIEVALSMVLLAGAMLLLRSFAKVSNVDPGFRPDGVLTFRLSLPRDAYPDEARRRAFFDALLERLNAVPGVERAGMIQTLPMRGNYFLSFDVVGRPPAAPGDETSASYRVATPDYFATLAIPLRRGRLFAAGDSDTSEPVTLIDEAFVRRYFPNEDPIGHQVAIGNGSGKQYRIVGVVGEVRQGTLAGDPAPTMYVPFAQAVFSTMWVVARADRDPAALTGSVRQAVRDLDDALPADGFATLETVIGESIAGRRFSTTLFALFGGLGLFLATIGLYGVVAYAVSQRTREIGLRVAIGAASGDVLRLVMGGGMKLVGGGIALGLVLAIALGRFIESLLFQLEPTDPLTLAATAVLLGVVAALACYVPARRAAHVDPLTALRAE